MAKTRTQLILEEQGYSNIHSPEKCAGQACMIHNPSKHKMVDWPINLRLDKGGPADRQCPHNVGHPDPDSMAFMAKRLGPENSRSLGTHGCDGCCRG
jgi:hypothetical protein